MCFALWHKLTVAVKKGYMKLLVRTVDTDVDVVAIITINSDAKQDKAWRAMGSVWCLCAVLVAIHVIWLALSLCSIVLKGATQSLQT